MGDSRLRRPGGSPRLLQRQAHLFSARVAENEIPRVRLKFPAEEIPQTVITTERLPGIAKVHSRQGPATPHVQFNRYRGHVFRVRVPLRNHPVLRGYIQARFSRFFPVRSHCGEPPSSF